MERSNLIKMTRVLIDDMYMAMDYLERHLDTISFSSMFEMIETIDKTGYLLKEYVIEETKVSVTTVLVNWSQLKIKTQRAFMNSRVALL